MNYKGNEPAYPSEEGTGMGYKIMKKGLNKRELFAAIAMQGLCSNPETYAAESNASEDEIARWSVQQADALLAELERTA